jgi:poly-gamma-glutamate capsule biosynthesis protein CapA/YwtB (metallophosphatase superfamily)
MILTGDVNLMHVDDPTVPYARVQDEFRATDVVFSNLECCLYDPPRGHAVENEGFFASPHIGGEALGSAGVSAVGIANNVNYGEGAILASIARLDALGIPHTGAGANVASARAPAIVQRGGLRYGFLTAQLGVLADQPRSRRKLHRHCGASCAHRDQVPMHKTRPEIPPMNRPGIPPIIITWADRDYLRSFADDIATLRQNADVVVASCHWGLHKEVLAYMPEIAHAAIDAGADLVIGHGPHYALPVEVYRGKAIFYGLGSFSFQTGHGGRRHGDWVGMMVRAGIDAGRVTRIGLQFVRHNEHNETVPCRLADEHAEFNDITTRSAPYGTRFIEQGDELLIVL